ncbi:hypothetical protein SBRCBS47491_010159 [Sporothrix bragantina]|uniref:Ankyrin repeat protein n=1 Tax=Sporothrix bragantina TaxID=671064 RepID=A0ABP0D3H4_9PEZI
MAPANPPARELDGGSGAGEGSGGGSGSSGKGSSAKSSSAVPGRIGRPPQWTSTRSRKLVRLYMYSTLSVDKILKVLEDDVFKPRKNSAQKTIHNMLDHDPRYLRPESREDMNQRVKLLAGSTQRKRRSWKKRGDIHQHQQQQQQHQQHQQQQQMSHHHHQPHLPPPMGHASSYDDGMHHGIKQEIGHVPQHSQHQHSQYHQQYAQHQQHSGHPQHLQQPHQLHHQQQLPPQPHHISQQYPSQTSTAFLPPPQGLHQPHQQQHHQQHSSHQPHHQQHQHQSQQPYNDFYHQQYQEQQQQQPPNQAHQQHPYPLSMQQMTHSMPPYMNSGWGGVYESQPQAADPASRLTMNSASFDMTQHQPGMTPLHASHQHAGHSQHLHQQHPQHSQHQHSHVAHGHQPHHVFHPGEHGGYDSHGHMGSMGGGITSSHLPMYGDHQRQRRMSSAAYSTDSDASSDVSTETIQDLKNRLSGCSTHYANQIANLLRRFTISNGSDDASSPAPSLALSGPRSGSNDNTDPHRIRKLWRQRKQKIRSRSVSSASSSASFDVFDSDADVYGEAEEDDTTRKGQSSQGGSNPASVNGATSPDGRDDSSMVRRAVLSSGGSKFANSGSAILGASGDNAGNPRLVLPGDCFTAYQYRDDANCPYHNKQQLLRDAEEKRQRQAEEDQKDRRGGRNGGNRANAKAPREPRCWCAIAEAVGAMALEDGSFWVLGDGQLTPEAQAMVQEQTQQRIHLTRRDRFGHSLLHLVATREGLQMQLLNMVLNSDDATLMAANTAGQTFLHLLTPGWFVGLQEPYSPMVQLLAHLRSRTRQPPPGGDSGSDAADDVSGGGPGSGNAIAHLIYATDVYGRSFFHRLGTFVKDPNILINTIGQHYDRAALARRDAFAHVPMPSLDVRSGGGSSSNASISGTDDYAAWQQSSTPSKPHHLQQHNLPALQYPGQTLSPRYDDHSPSQASPIATPALGGGNVPTVFSSEDAFIRHHESLLRTVTASDNNPSVEDPEGRNGLHCLAEAIVDKRMMDEHRNALSSGRKLPKKKTFEKKDPNAATGSSGGSSFMNGLLLGGESGSASDGGPTYSSSSPYMALANSNTSPALGGATSAQSLLHTSVDGAQMATRLRLVQGLLSPPIVVDVNHYDRRGQTVLTAFVVHIADDQEDKAKSLVAILETLLSAGARIEGRNRRGETALLVAARLGRKIALTALLDHGANVHARDAAGRGVLDVLDMQCRRQGRQNVALYGRLEACRVLLTSIKQLPLGVKQRPSLMDEWTIIHRRGPEPRDINMAM